MESCWYLLIVGACVDVNFCRIHAHYERSKFSTLQLGRTDKEYFDQQPLQSQTTTTSELLNWTQFKKKINERSSRIVFSLKPRGPNQEFDPSFDRIAKERKVLFDHFCG